jgi:hypothetical protein
VALTQYVQAGDERGNLAAIPEVLLGKGRHHQMLLHADLDLKSDDVSPHTAREYGAGDHLGPWVPRSSWCRAKTGPQRKHSRSDQHGKPEDPDPQHPHDHAVKVATADDRQARAHHRHADQGAITRRQAGLAPRPLTRNMRGALQRSEGVVQRTAHPHDHDHDDTHGNANACEHVGHRRVDRERRGTSNIVTMTARQSSFLQSERRCMSWVLPGTLHEGPADWMRVKGANHRTLR